MSERIDVRITGDSSDLDSAAKKGARALANMGRAADKAGASIDAVSLGTVNLAAGIAVADRVAQSIGRMAKATYDSALAFRDAAEAEGRMLSPEILAGLAQSEAAIARMNDSAGELAATLVSEASPALGVFSSLWANFATGAGAAGGFVLENAGIGLAAVVDATGSAIDATGRLGQGFTAGLNAVTGWTEAGTDWTETLDAMVASQVRMAPATERTTRAVQAQTAAIYLDTKAKDAAREAEAKAFALASIHKAEAVAEAAREAARAELEIASEKANAIFEIEAEASNRALAQKAANTQAAIALTGQGIDLAVAATKKGSKANAIAQKAAAVFHIGQATAEAIAAANAVGFPANILAIASAALVGATALAQSKSAAIPSFDRGGVVTGGPSIPGGRPNQVLAQVEVGERIQTRGQQEGGGGSPINLSLRVGSREFARAVIDSGATNGLQRRRGFGQRRYGG